MEDFYMISVIQVPNQQEDSTVIRAEFLNSGNQPNVSFIAASMNMVCV